LPQVGIEPPIGTPQFLTLTYRRSSRAAVSAIEHQIASDLGGNWTAATPVAIEQLPADPVTGDPRLRLKFPIPPGEKARYIRLVVTP
jgi:hypothetical protein